MAKSPISDKDRDKAVKKLIRDTASCAGELPPDEIPHRVRDRLKRQASGALSPEDYAREAKTPSRRPRTKRK